MSAEKKVKMVHFQSQKDEQENQKPQSVPEQILKEIRKDMGKVALIVSVLAVFLMVVFFFTIKYNVSTMNERINSLSMMKEDVVALDNTVSQVQDRVSTLEDLPQEMKSIVYANILQEMSQKTDYLSQQLDGEQQTKILEARKLLQQVEEGMRR